MRLCLADKAAVCLLTHSFARHAADGVSLLLLLPLVPLLPPQDWYEGITRKLKWNQSIRGVPGTAGAGLEAAILHTTAAAGAHAAELQPQLSLGGLVSDLTAAAHNEAKVTNWVEEVL